MIIAYLNKDMLTPQDITEENQALLKEATWIDLLSPTKAEDKIIEQHLGLEIPTRAEMREIELSSRLYEENGTLFMTAMMLAQWDSKEPEYDAVTFVLTKQQLLTIRYIEPHSFRLFTSRIHKLANNHQNAIAFFIELLDATVERLADILEAVGHRLEEYSKTIFQPHRIRRTPPKLDYQRLMQKIGANADLNTKARESLVAFNRLITFFGQMSASQLDEEGRLRLSTSSKDILALSDHANFLSSKVNFLLDATLGLVSIDQNKIIKIFSVAAVIFLPPTLIASIYGMNFHFMPELSWKWGYLVAIGLMILSALLPYKYFKHQKWL